jgi:hypothetical protein
MPNHPALVVIRRFRELPPAQVALTALEASGIPAELRNQNVAAIDWFYSDAIGGISLVIPAEFSQEAETVLSQQGEAEPLADTPPDVLGPHGHSRPFASRRRVALYVLGVTALVYVIAEIALWLRP